MLFLKIACSSYLVYMILGRIVNYDQAGDQKIKARLIDNITIICLMVIMYFLVK